MFLILPSKSGLKLAAGGKGCGKFMSDTSWDIKDSCCGEEAAFSIRK